MGVVGGDVGDEVGDVVGDDVGDAVGPGEHVFVTSTHSPSMHSAKQLPDIGGGGSRGPEYSQGTVALGSVV